MKRFIELIIGGLFMGYCSIAIATEQNTQSQTANFEGLKLAVVAPVYKTTYYKHSYPIYAGRIYNPKYYYGRYYSPYNNKVYYPRYYTPRYRGERIYYPSYRTYYYRGGQYR
jgi:hypothetical protein